MSRIGRKPVVVPDKVKVEEQDGSVTVTGALGSLKAALPRGIGLTFEGSEVLVDEPKKTRANSGYRGLARALIANMVEGVSKGYERKLEISGVGYKAEHKGDVLTFALGYSHTIDLKLPSGIAAEVNKQQNEVTIKGIDKQLVGQIAAKIRSYKVAEPYKGKGVKYADENIRRKVGKAGAK